MTQAEMMQQVIEFAIEKGFKVYGLYPFGRDDLKYKFSVTNEHYRDAVELGKVHDKSYTEFIGVYSFQEIIYAPDRALLKAVFGYKDIGGNPAWMNKGTMMFLSGDEVQYLYDFILSKEK